MPEQEISEEELEKMNPEQIAELQKKNCIFCHIAEGKVPAKKVYEDEHCIAILDINPASKGHMLLMPREHYMVLPQAPQEVIGHLGKITKNLSRSALRALGAEGTNIFIGNGVIAGQRAPHAIIHIIPRYEGDGITCFQLPEKNIPENDMQSIQKVLATALGTKIEAKKEEKLEEIDLRQLKNML